MVDLPEPDSPTRAMVSPSRTWTVTSFTARTSPTLRRRNPPEVRGKVFFTFSADKTILRSSRGMPSKIDGIDSPTEYTSLKVKPSRTILSLKWHADNWPERPSTSCKAGTVSRHTSVARGQRSAKAHPLGRFTKFVGEPGIGTNREFLDCFGWGTAPSNPMVYGITGR